MKMSAKMLQDAVQFGMRSRRSTRSIVDEQIQGTNDSSIISKRSVEKLYCSGEAEFFRYFVSKYQRRSPLVNRIYWLRKQAIDRRVTQFLKSPSEKSKIIINLGCGSDVLPWQCHARSSESCENVLFIDVDYVDLMRKKLAVILETPQLRGLLGNDFSVSETGGDPLILRSKYYCQLGCDLRNLHDLQSCLRRVSNLGRSRILFIAEVSIAYMETLSADSLIEWASSVGEAEFCLMEQIAPAGASHPFAKTMLSYYEKLRAAPKSVMTYPGTQDQYTRFIERGWQEVHVKDLWEVWISEVHEDERLKIDFLEPFDEWEEFMLFCRHWFILQAKATSGCESGKLQKPQSLSEQAQERFKLRLQVSEPGSKSVARRFGNSIPLLNSRGENFAVHILGAGSTGRCDNYGIFGQEGCTQLPNIPLAGPAPRMCGTLTDLGEFGWLLVGGRNSPSNVIGDCWILNKGAKSDWHQTWPIPLPLYRHAALRLGNTGLVFVSGGKTSPTSICEAYFIFDAAAGWSTCYVTGTTKPVLFGHCVSYETRSSHGNLTYSGLMFGGMGKDGLINSSIFKWKLDLSQPQPVISFEEASRTAYETRGLSVFGAQIAEFEGQVYICGGIGLEPTRLGQQISIIASEIYTGEVYHCGTVAGSEHIPFMIGSSVSTNENGITILGGGATCFPSGTYWETRSFNLTPMIADEEASSFERDGKFLRMVLLRSHTVVQHHSDHVLGSHEPTEALQSIPRVRLDSADDFSNILERNAPVIIEGLDLGACLSRWNPDYLVDSVGGERNVVIHECQRNTEQMDFQSKNFTYLTESFESFMKKAVGGAPVYLRALSQTHPAELPARLEEDFPSLGFDFQLPSQLKFVQDQMFSSVLRISGKANMWLHYDVMSNVYCQIRGEKRMIVFPPANVTKLYFAPAVSSSSFDVFSALKTRSLRGTQPLEGILKPGDVLFLPSMWLHTAAPITDMSIAVNIFFRDLTSGYSAGRDVYGNKDLAAYEKSRNELARLSKNFQDFPRHLEHHQHQSLFICTLLQFGLDGSVSGARPPSTTIAFNGGTSCVWDLWGRCGSEGLSMFD